MFVNVPARRVKDILTAVGRFKRRSLLNAQQQHRFHHEIKGVNSVYGPADDRFGNRFHSDDERDPVLGEVRLLLKGIDVDRFVRDDFSDAGHDAALVFYGKPEVPADGFGTIRQSQGLELRKPGMFLAVHLSGGEVAGDLDEVGDDGRPGRVSASAATVEHLRADLVADEEYGVVDALDFRKHRAPADQPGAH